jgi:hypothetical protein
MRRLMCLAFVLLLAIAMLPINASSALINAAVHAETAYDGRANSNTVTVKVILLRDNDGTPVTGLTKSNFKLVKVTDGQHCTPRDFAISVSGGSNGIYTMTFKPSSGTWIPSGSYSETFAFTFLVSKGSDYGTLEIFFNASYEECN